MQSKQNLQVAVLTLVALGLLYLIFYTPIWWVSLTAPNYPEESFPDGVRIHFHMNGVFNGCEKQQKSEITEDEALDCVHEMDTINHYVGMYPIAAGGPVERGFSQFLMAFMGVMLIGFMFTAPKKRMIVLAVGFIGIAAWMSYTLYGKSGFNLENEGYVSALVTSLDQEAGNETKEPEIVIGGWRTQGFPGRVRRQGGAAFTGGSREAGQTQVRRGGKILPYRAAEAHL